MSLRSGLAQRIADKATIHGEFLLRSGATSNVYFDKYLFEADPELLKDITAGMAELIPEGTEALAGLEMGGIPLVTMLSQITGIPSLFVRKEAKKYGTCKLAEGGDVKGRKIVIVEDVVTSGGQIILSAKELRELGADILCVLCVIDREAGGVEKLAAEGLELRPLFKRSDLEKDA
ncbi:MAG: orotate phosphoribosyltransferase [Verrucomicrobia bacterium]|nr:orotate phosphoribosyltransferase [Verrucomicrobiota bacterium]